MSYFSWYFIDSYLFSPSHPKTRPLHRGHRWCRWSLKKAYKLVSEDRKKRISFDEHSRQRRLWTPAFTNAEDSRDSPSPPGKLRRRWLSFRRPSRQAQWDSSRLHLRSVPGLLCPARCPAPPPSYLRATQEGSVRAWKTDARGKAFPDHACASWRTISGGRVPLLLVVADEHSEGRIRHVKALQNVHKHTQWVHTEGNKVVVVVVVVGASTWHTNRLHGLEEAVEDQVPEHLPLLKRRHVPDQEVGQHGKRCGAKDPGKRSGGGVFVRRQRFAVFSNKRMCVIKWARIFLLVWATAWLPAAVGCV